MSTALQISDLKSQTGNGGGLKSAIHTPRPRKVFGRREGQVDGKTFRFEMRSDGVHLWRKRGRKRKHVSWTDLVHVAEGQGLLKLT